MHYSNMPALSNSIGTRKIEGHTNDIECEATSKSPPAMQTTEGDNRDGKVIGNFRLIAVALLKIPETAIWGIHQ